MKKVLGYSGPKYCHRHLTIADDSNIDASVINKTQKFKTIVYSCSKYLTIWPIYLKIQNYSFFRSNLTESNKHFIERVGLLECNSNLELVYRHAICCTTFLTTSYDLVTKQDNSCNHQQQNVQTSPNLLHTYMHLCRWTYFNKDFLC